MSAELLTIDSDFDTAEEAASYDRWFRAQVQEALDDPRPAVPHAEAMVMLDQMIDENRRKRRAAG
ncbi:stability determinant [Pseudomonas sp. SWRI153]|uniref:Stability determinant n=1 Tax=Pseudomonas khorasanensis TaxID=2745508 RepID=A0A923F1U1_9PSED|nr:stability determinant [Pseudomonas khorasanensis]MBV4485148.1 stability determinant [Pseudomonas khorasanensis]